MTVAPLETAVPNYRSNCPIAGTAAAAAAARFAFHAVCNCIAWSSRVIHYVKVHVIVQLFNQTAVTFLLCKYLRVIVCCVKTRKECKSDILTVR